MVTDGGRSRADESVAGGRSAGPPTRNGGREGEITRRDALAATVGGLLAASCAGDPPSPEPSGPDGADSPVRPATWVKDPSGFVQHGTNLESSLADLGGGLITPVERFFVRNHSPTPIIDAGDFRLTVGGPGAEREVQLSLDDLQALPSHTVVAYLECAGNWRRFFQTVLGQTASGSQWGTGAVGCAEWSGPRLGDVLALAGVRPDALDVNLVGLDDSEWQRPMPLAKAMDDATLLALSMNGAPLHPDHGFPVRAVLPGWVGSSSVKWVGRIEIATEKVWVPANTTSYVLAGEPWPPEDYAPADGAPISEGVVKSALALPHPAELSAGRQRIRGFAYSPNGPVDRVEWTVTDAAGTAGGAGGNAGLAEGATEWREARLIGPQLPHAWTRFELDWDAAPGRHVLGTRATDAAGDRQPLDAVYNAKGYLLNLVLPHPVTVG